ncbi:MAG TPA: FecR domain-containing protein, partial [Holophaga sp.]|nr:FecR domain-containing protein [Holophaga sp.]
MFSETPRTHMLALVLAPVAILAPAPFLQAQEAEEDAYLGEAPERYAQVKVLEGEARIRKGDVDEELGRGVPVAEGDVIESRGRGVLQLGDGSRIAFAGDTRFRILALFANREGDRQVLLALDRGRLRVQVGRDSEGRIRVDTPSGSGVLTEGDSVTFEVDSDRTTRVRVHAGRIAFSNTADQARLAAGERLTVYGDRK